MYRRYYTLGGFLQSIAADTTTIHKICEDMCNDNTDDDAHTKISSFAFTMQRQKDYPYSQD